MVTKTYEGLFLLDPTSASQDWDGLKNKIVALIERREGKILNAKKWGERRLAYEIKGRKRGTYLLIYFEMPPKNISTLKRDIQLAELVLRNMIVVHDRAIDPETLNKSYSESDMDNDETRENTSEEEISREA